MFVQWGAETFIAKLSDHKEYLYLPHGRSLEIPFFFEGVYIKILKEGVSKL